MRFLNRIFCVVSTLLMLSFVACVESTEMSFDEIETIALKEWMTQNHPDLLDSYQPMGGYYVELLDEGCPDSLPVRHSDAWVRFDVTCRDLAGNIVLTRNDEYARLQNSYTEHTHYVPFFLYCGETNTSMPEGTYMSIRNKLNIHGKEYAARYGTKMRLYLPSSIAAGDQTMGGDGGYEGQYELDANRPMIVELQVWGHINNPVAYEDQWIKSFAAANGGVIAEDKAAEESASKMNERLEKGEKVEYDDKWRLAVDSIAALYINYNYTPKKSLNFDCLREDTLLYKNQTAYSRGKIYGTKSLEQINKEIDEALLKRFGEGIKPEKAEAIDSVYSANVWYITRLMDGFVVDTNIREVKEIIYAGEEITTEDEALDFTVDGDTSYVDAWKYAIPQLKLGAWNAILTGSSNAYGATGVSGTRSSSSSSNAMDYYDYYNYYNYYNSYYGNNYYNNYYDNYYGYGYGGYGGYGGYYNNYYDSFYYNNYFNDSYFTDSSTTTTTITSEIQPYSPLLFQVYLEPRKK